MSTPESPPTQPDPSSPGGPDRSLSGGPIWRILLAVVTVVVIVGGVVLLASGGGSSSRPNSSTAPGVASPLYKGSLASPAQAEPPLRLHNYKGEPIDIAQYKGKAVLVTFIYTHCPDVCPLIASNLGVALNELGPAKAAKVQVIAVSVDPRGDTPNAVGAFLQRHGVSGRMQYLLGTAHELGRVWKAWGVGAESDAKDPELVNHSGLVYGIDAHGKVTTLYAANFTPAEIVHDAPLLASS
jgi:protein SCO1/2